MNTQRHKEIVATERYSNSLGKFKIGEGEATSVSKPVGSMGEDPKTDQVGSIQKVGYTRKNIKGKG